MFETTAIPDDLETCQQLLRELMEAYRQLDRVHGELLAISTDMRDSQEKLEQEKAALEETVKELTHRLYGRRSERLESSPGQLTLSFGEEDPVVILPDVEEDKAFVEQYEQRRRQGRKRKRRGRACRPADASPNITNAVRNGSSRRCRKGSVWKTAN
jgi:hypothetical protein